MEREICVNYKDGSDLTILGLLLGLESMRMGNCWSFDVELS
jgi:hypothetical protein